MDWGTVSCTMTFAPGGSYACDWPGCKYIGTWGVRDGLLWMSERTGGSPDSYQTYAVRLKPQTLAGPIEVGMGAGMELRLLRRTVAPSAPRK